MKGCGSMKFSEYLKSINACPEAVEWVGDRTLEKSWAECENGEWMLSWLVKKKGHGRRGWPKHKQIVLCACAIAERALRFVAVGEDRPRLAIEAARQCAKKRISTNVGAASRARDAAWAAGDAAGVAAGAAAGWAARDAAWAAGAAAGAAKHAAGAAQYAAWAARDAGWAAWAARDAGWAAEVREQANICRKFLRPGRIEGVE